LKKRSDLRPPRILLLDNYDSFTYNLYDYLLQAGAECRVVRNDALPLKAFETLGFEAIALSPGPKRPADAGLMMSLIERWHRRVPMLGICLGHQAIGEFFGAKLVKARLPMHGKTSEISLRAEHPLFADLPRRFSVMRYHSLLLESLHGTPLEVLAATDSGEIMALAHRSLPLTGVQFHPESVLTEHGLRLVRNWVASLTFCTPAAL
jgi:anthranilate synthase/aminodeoxychorismate synthase-like glutamine amidotransferase